jgi:hypothetical protein
MYIASTPESTREPILYSRDCDVGSNVFAIKYLQRGFFVQEKNECETSFEFANGCIMLYILPIRTTVQEVILW